MIKNPDPGLDCCERPGSGFFEERRGRETPRSRNETLDKHEKSYIIDFDFYDLTVTLRLRGHCNRLFK